MIHVSKDTSHRSTPVKGFTLIELLVVMAVIAVLVALILPAVQNAREAARRSTCQNHLKQIGIALQTYHVAQRALPSGFIGVDATSGLHDINGINSFGWGTMILPLLDQENLYKELNTKLPMLDAFNSAGIAKPVVVFRCPSDGGADAFEINDASGAILGTLSSANYVGHFGTKKISDCYATPNQQCKADGLLFHNSLVRLRDVTDGQSSTFLVGERRSGEPGGLNSTWVGAAPNGENSIGRVLGTAFHKMNSANQHAFSSTHVGGCFMLTCDGAAKFVSEEIDKAVWQGLGTHRGDELIGEF